MKSCRKDAQCLNSKRIYVAIKRNNHFKDGVEKDKKTATSKSLPPAYSQKVENSSQKFISFSFEPFATLL